MHTRLSVFAVVLCASVGLTCKAGEKGTAVGSAAPAFALQDENGKQVSLADYGGKIVVIQWWNEGCPYVQRHAKAGTGNALAEKYKEQGVVVLAVNSTKGSGNESNKKAAGQFKLTYPILNDSAGQVGRSYGAKTTPHMFVIDKSGNLAYSGAADDDPNGDKAAKTNYVAQAIDELLAGKTVSVPETKPYGCSVKY